MHKFWTLTFAALLSGCTALCNAETIKIVSTLERPLTETILRGYQQATGHKAEITYISSRQFSEKLNSLEKKDMDCLIGPHQEEMYLADHAGLLQPYASELLYTVPQNFQAKKNAWTNVWVDYVAFLSNGKRLQKENTEAPESWLDLISPRFKNELAVPDYEFSPSLFAGITGIWQIQGETMALHYAYEWNKQKIKFTDTSKAAAEEVTKGKKLTTILTLSRALAWQSNDTNLVISIPKDANRCLLTGAAIARNTQQENLARSFIDYLLSEDCIKTLQESPYSTLQHVRQPESPLLPQNLKIAIDDLGWSAAAKKDIIRRWKKA